MSPCIKCNGLKTNKGFALLPIAIVIAVIASIALLISNQTAMDVHSVASQTEQSQARYVAQAAMQHALHNANTSDCTGYSLPTTSFGSHSYSATFTPDNGSPVSIAATGTLANGVSHTINRNIIKVYETNSSTLVLQPDATIGKDAWITSLKPDWNHGAQNILKVSPVQRSLIEFDLSGIPTDARIVSSQLELNLVNNVSSGTVDIHHITTPWLEGTCVGAGCTADGATWDTSDSTTSWTTAGVDHQTYVVDSQFVNAQGSYTWNVSSLVSAWVKDPTQNYGLLLKSTDGANAEFESSDSSDPNNYPKFTINFTCECGQSCTALSNNKLLFVVNDVVNINADEQLRIDLFESWGYTVSLIDDSATQAAVEIAITANDVVYVSATVNHLELNTKLINAEIGVVNEEINLVTVFKISDTRTIQNRDNIEILNNSHYITEGFNIGTKVLYTSTQPSGLTITPASGAQILAEMNNVGPNYDPSLVVVDIGAQLTDGSSAAGKRVQLPWDNIDISSLNEDSQIIMRRAIEWAATVSDAEPGLGLVAHWKLDDASGITAVDSVGGHDGTLGPFTGPTWDVGKFEGALRFDGLDDEVVVPHSNELSITEAITLSAWVNNTSSSIADSYRIISKETNGSNDNFFFSIQNKALWLGIGGNYFSPSIELFPNQWYHVAGTFDDAADEVRIYIDGVEVFSTSTNATLSENTDDIIIGSNWQDYKYWEGLLDDIRIYNRALTGGEIADLAQLPITSPIAYWKLDEGTGTKAVDSVGGHDGDLINGPVWNTNGQSNGALEFDESNDYIQIPNFSYGNEFTVSFGFKIDDNSGSLFKYMFSHGDINDYNSLNIFLNENSHGTDPNMLRTVIRDTNDALSNTALEFDVSSIVGDGKWHTYTLTVASGVGANVYLDGVLRNSYASGGEGFNPITDLYLGARQDLSSGRFFGGLLDEIRIFNGALTSAEIAELAQLPITSPIAYWKLDETTGTTAVDTVGGHDGTLYNGPFWTTGQVGGGLELDGINDYVYVSDSSSLHLADGTIQAWINVDDNINEQYLFHKAGSGKIFIRVKDGEVTYETNGDTIASPIQANQWYLVTANFGSEGMKLYLNENLVASSSKTDSMVNNYDDIYIGADSSAVKAFNGTIDDVRIYDRALSAIEIANLTAASGGGGGGCNATLGDDFETSNFSGSTGSMPWSGPWQEIGESDGPGSSDVAVISFNQQNTEVLRIRDNDNGGEGVMRTFDASEFTSGTLSFTYQRSGLDNANDYITVDISSDGGSNWVEIHRFAGPDNDSAFIPINFDISSYTGSELGIRFLGSPNLGGQDQIFIDDVEICVNK